MLHPRSCSLAAKSAWDQRLFARHSRTLGPIRFNAGLVTISDGSEKDGVRSVHMHTL